MVATVVESHMRPCMNKCEEATTVTAIATTNTTTTTNKVRALRFKNH